MADTKVATQNKAAMSRALATAFLNHQVEQLEKKVSSQPPRNANWRDRNSNGGGGGYQDRTGTHGYNQRRTTPTARGEIRIQRPGEVRVQNAKRNVQEAPSPTIAKRQEAVEAEVLVLDASALIHCLGQVKAWCRDGREEVLVVPLEALNTLDLLKKGTSALAQRARTASRMLEAQVGTNPRIRVQSDDAFVLWDSIQLDASATDTTAVGPAAANENAPEWVRRTICCARYEADKATASSKRAALVVATSPTSALAVEHTKGTGPGEDAPVVPPPAPHVQKHEPRATGGAVAAWALRAGLRTLEIAPALEDEERERERGSQRRGGGGGGGGGRERRRGSVSGAGGANGYHHHHQHHHSSGSGGGGGGNGGGGAGGGGGLVERPPAVKAMMEAVSQPSRVVRVLARGEKLDPDT